MRYATLSWNGLSLKIFHTILQCLKKKEKKERKLQMAHRQILIRILSEFESINFYSLWNHQEK